MIVMGDYYNVILRVGTHLVVDITLMWNRLLQTVTNYSLFADMMIGNDVIYDEECKNCVLFPSCYGGCSAHRKMKADYCIPAKSSLGDYLDIKYLQWKKMQEYNKITK